MIEWIQIEQNEKQVLSDRCVTSILLKETYVEPALGKFTEMR